MPRHPMISRALGVIRRALAPLDSLRDDGELPLLVACSGGADSMSLLGLLCLLAHSERLRICVGHVDHGLRPTSSSDAALVLEVARARGLVCRTAKLSLEAGPGIPARARDARRSALAAQMSEIGARAIALGHTATDQAETVLMHLARGAGLDGLSAMPSHEVDACAITWTRPLLGITRDDTRRLVELLELPFVDDPTNLELKAPRIAIRQRVLPVLRGMSSRAELAIAAVADRAREADEALRTWIERELKGRRLPDASSERWSVEDADGLPAAVRRGLVRAICLRAGFPADAIGRRLTEDVADAMCRRGAAHVWDLHGGRRLRLQRRVLWLEPADSSSRS